MSAKIFRCCNKFVLNSVQYRTLICNRRVDNAVNVTEIREQLKDIIGTSSHFKGSRAADVTSIIWPTNQTDLKPTPMKSSYCETLIPLKTNVDVRNSYVNFWETVRIGKLLEDLDIFAVLIAYMHNAEGEGCFRSPLSIVTAGVDRLVLQGHKIVPDEDILLRGHVSWVGTSSIEVILTVEQQSKTTNEWKNVLETTFLLVARDPKNEKKAVVRPLLLETDEERKYFSVGAEHRKSRQADAQRSLLRTPPSEMERLTVHDLFLRTIDSRSATLKHFVKPPGTEWMQDTHLKNVFICFPEQRNMYNKVFGGFLMRAAFELGFANAWVYSKDHISVIGMDDIMFKKPVEIGSLLYLSSQIVYTCGNKMQTMVHAEVVDPRTGEHQTTNIFYFLFQSKIELPEVIPSSYAEYMMYLDGQRHFNAFSDDQSIFRC